MPKLTDPKTIGTFEHYDGKNDGHGEARDDKLTDNGPRYVLGWYTSAVFGDRIYGWHLA